MTTIRHMRCEECGDLFIGAEYTLAHTGPDGGMVHESCCRKRSCVGGHAHASKLGVR